MDLFVGFNAVCMVCLYAFYESLFEIVIYFRLHFTSTYEA